VDLKTLGVSKLTPLISVITFCSKWKLNYNNLAHWDRHRADRYIDKFKRQPGRTNTPQTDIDAFITWALNNPPMIMRGGWLKKVLQKQLKWLFLEEKD
jgi:hypothetical protein